MPASRLGSGANNEDSPIDQLWLPVAGALMTASLTGGHSTETSENPAIFIVKDGVAFVGEASLQENPFGRQVALHDDADKTRP
jgi:hypothetical protein